MNGRYVKAGIVLGGLVALVATGCATGMKMGSGDIVADRQRLMKLNGASWADAQATEVIMKEFGAKGCGTCPTPFRVPPPRQG